MFQKKIFTNKESSLFRMTPPPIPQDVGATIDKAVYSAQPALQNTPVDLAN